MNKYIISYTDEVTENRGFTECYALSEVEARIKFYIKRKGSKIERCFIMKAEGRFEECLAFTVFKPRQGILSRYANKVVNHAFYGIYSI